jgi:hypothetical protein
MLTNSNFIPTLNDCFEQAKKLNHKFFIARDTSNSTKEYFSFKNVNSFLTEYEYTKPVDRFYYELINKKEEPLYENYDLDLKINYTNSHFTNEDIFNFFIDIRLKFLLQSNYPNIDKWIKPHWIITTASKEGEKLSLHVINRNIILKDHSIFHTYYQHLKYFVDQQIPKSHHFYNLIDFCICGGNRFMRIIHSAKRGSNRFLKFWKESHPVEHTFISTAYLDPQFDDKVIDYLPVVGPIKPKKIKVEKVKSKLNKHEQIDKKIKQFDNDTIDSDDTETKNENEIKVKKYADEYVNKLLNKLTSNYLNVHSDWIKILMILKHENFDFDFFYNWSKQCTIEPYSEEKTRYHWDRIKDDSDNPFTMKNLRKFAYPPSKFKPFEFNPSSTFQSRFITPDIYVDNFKKVNTIFLKSPMFTGKTHSLPELFKTHQKVLIVYHRISLNEAIFNKFQKFGFKLYSKIEGPIDMDKHKRVICQIDSLHRINNKCDLIILDEIESTLSHISQSPHMTKRDDVFRTLKTYIKKSNYLISCDANLKQQTINFINDIRENKPNIILHNTYKSLQHYKYTFLPSFEQTIHTIKQKCDQDKKVIIVSNSKDRLQVIHNIIKQDYPDKSIKLIDSEHKCDDFQWNHYEIVLYSPTITCGISYDEKHFDCCIASFSRFSCNAEDCSQMLIRVRHFSENKMYIHCNDDIEDFNAKPTDDEELDLYLLNKVKIGNSYYLDCGFDIDKFDLQINKNDFYNLYKQQLKKNNTSYNFFKSYLKHILDEHGMQYFYDTIEKDEEKNKETSKRVKKEKKQIEEERYIQIYRKESGIIQSQSQVDKLKQSRVPLTSFQKSGIRRFKFDKAFDKLNLSDKDTQDDKNLMYRNPTYSFEFLKHNYKYSFAYENYKRCQNINIDEKIEDLKSDETDANISKIKEILENEFLEEDKDDMLVGHYINYKTFRLRQIHCLEFIRKCGFNSVDDNKSVVLDYKDVYEYCRQNEENIRTVFDCKKVEWNGKLDRTEKITLAMYINHKLESMFGISIGKTLNSGKVKTYCIKKLYDLDL